MWLQNIWVTTLIICLSFFGAHPTKAQLSLDVEVNETLSNSQSINISSLVANNGRGPSLFRMYLKNNDSDYANNLYFRIIVESDKIGRIIEVRQVSGQPFSLNPGQQVFATNNNIGDGLPGVEEIIQFDGTFSESGKEFVNDLQGSTSLPADQYQIRIEIHRGSATGELLAAQNAEIGRNIVEDTRDFYLLSPGDVAGSQAMVSSNFPNFQWQGNTGTEYRLLTVEGRGNESPQSLMDGAMSTSPIQTNGSASSGSLVDYEMLDVVVNQSGFQYPNAGVQSLEPGKTYYWRIVSQIQSTSGLDGRESEIWSFTLREGQIISRAQASGDMSQVLQQLLGNRFEQIVEDDYSFQSIVIDGQSYRGAQAMEKLRELGRQAQDGDISIVIEEQ